MKKKIYSTPTSEFINMDTAAIMLTTSITGNVGDKTDEFDASEHRSDWDNIWANM